MKVVGLSYLYAALNTQLREVISPQANKAGVGLSVLEIARERVDQETIL